MLLTVVTPPAPGVAHRVSKHRVSQHAYSEGEVSAILWGRGAPTYSIQLPRAARHNHETRRPAASHCPPRYSRRFGAVLVTRESISGGFFLHLSSPAGYGGHARVGTPPGAGGSQNLGGLQCTDCRHVCLAKGLLLAVFDSPRSLPLLTSPCGPASHGGGVRFARRLAYHSPWWGFRLLLGKPVEMSRPRTRLP